MRLVIALCFMVALTGPVMAYDSWDWRGDSTLSFGAQLEDIIAEFETFLQRAETADAANPALLAELQALLGNTRELVRQVQAPTSTSEQPPSRWDRVVGTQLQSVSGPAGHWVFRDALEGTARDSSPARNHGTVLGPTPTTDPFGNEGQAYWFDGSRPDQHIYVGHSPIFSGRDLFALTAWIRPVGLSSSWGTIISKHSTLGDGEWYLAVRRSGFRLAHVGDGGVRRNLEWQYEVPENEWTHVAVTFERGKVTLYVNAHEIGTLQSSGGTNSTTWPVLIGTIAGEGLDSGWNFRGALYDVRFYNRTLYSGYVASLVPRPALGF